MPMLKICTPPPDMYSMNACMGSDLSGEIAKSHAFRVFNSSYELNASYSSSSKTCRRLIYPTLHCTPLSVRGTTSRFSALHL